MRLFVSVIAFAAVATLLIVACGGGDQTATPGAGVGATSTPATTPMPEPDAAFDYPSGDDDLVLLINVTGGTTGTDIAALDVPWLAVYGDGRVITQGPVIAIYPPPALPNLQQGRISPEGIQALLRAANDAGLMDGDADYTGSNVTDAQTTTFIVTVDGTTTTVTVYGLEHDELAPDASEEEIEARESLRMFRQQAVDYRSLVPPEAIEQEQQAYEVERLQLVIVPADEPLVPADPGVTPGTMTWPLETPPSDFGEPFDLPNSRCGVVDGADLDVMLPAMQEATQLTQWESDDGLFAVYPRPLLPHEQGCAANE